MVRRRARPGCRADAPWLHGRRALQGRVGDGSHQYMALYAFESAAKLADALSGPAIRELIKIYDRDIGAFSTRVRTTYERVLLHAKTS